MEAVALRRLIINADDFGFFRAVSRGILDCVASNTVSAVGVMATGPALAEYLPHLLHYKQVDTGVHLVLTYGMPLSQAMREQYPEGFPDKGRLLRDLISRRLSKELVATEWRRQIQHCLDAGMRPLFCNGHEHVHLLAPLWGLTLDLAKEFHIPFVRETGPGPGKAMMLRMMHLPNRRQPEMPSPLLLGSDCSGNLSMDCVEEYLAMLKDGQVAELMCHPGRDDHEELADPRLRAFHNWEGERTVLCNPRFKALLAQWDTGLIGFRDLL